MAKRKKNPLTEWKCFRCRAGQEWINRNRTRCLRCQAGREWLERHFVVERHLR